MARRAVRKFGTTQRKRRGIYVLPNLLTTGALFFGFFAIIQATVGRFEDAAIAVLIATVLDGLDGRVARLTNTSSDFGKEYDSLSDVICFGLAPALIAFEWTLSGLGKAGWLCAFVYVSATALRLARFNTHSAPDPRYFQGLPCPMSAAFFVLWMWFVISTFGEQYAYLVETTTVILLLLALAMVSAVPYLSFKNFGVKGRVPFITSVLFVLVIALISFDPPKVLFALCLMYLASGPFIWAYKNIQDKKVQPVKEAVAARKVDDNDLP